MSVDRNEVAIFWDFASCPAPAGDLCGYTVVRNIRSLALRFGNIQSFKAYLSVSDHNSMVPDYRALLFRSQLQSSGVSLTDVPGEKNVADKMLIVDMLAYAFDRASTSTMLVLISADATLAYALSILRLRNHHVVVISPPETQPALAMQASLSFDWNVEIVGKSYTRSRSTESQRTVSRKGGDRDKATAQITSLHATDVKLPNDPMVDVGLPDEDYHLNFRPSSASIEAPGLTPLELEASPGVAIASDLSMSQASAGEGLCLASRLRIPFPEPENPSQYKCQRTLGQERPAFKNDHEVAGDLEEQPPEAPASYSSSSSPPASKPRHTNAKKKIPSGFEPLVGMLRSLRAQGMTHPLRSVVGFKLLEKDPEIYQKVGSPRFTQYADAAVELGLVELGGLGGRAWMSLRPTL